MAFVPSELTEGGRRLYSEDDLKRMRIICFFREAGLPSTASESCPRSIPAEILLFCLINRSSSFGKK
ncbi:MAG: MerR family transcriptional regulator [Lachnoclostridium sp.]